MFLCRVSQFWLTNNRQCVFTTNPSVVYSIYGAVCVQLAHFSIGDWKDISIDHIIIIIKSEVSTVPIIIIFFPWLYVWDDCYIIFCYLLHIPFEKQHECVFIMTVQFMMSANNRIRFGLKIVFVSLYITPYHYHHCANLSEDIELIKCLSDIICRVCD